MWDNTASWLVARFNPRDRTKESWKCLNFLLSGQQRRRINRNQKFILMAHARILFCSDRCLFSGVEISLYAKLRLISLIKLQIILSLPAPLLRSACKDENGKKCLIYRAKVLPIKAVNPISLHAFSIGISITTTFGLFQKINIVTTWLWNTAPVQTIYVRKCSGTFWPASSVETWPPVCIPTGAFC
jgi:hypothetical protein